VLLHRHLVLAHGCRHRPSTLYVLVDLIRRRPRSAPYVGLVRARRACQRTHPPPGGLTPLAASRARGRWARLRPRARGTRATSSAASATADLVYCRLDLFLVNLIRLRRAFLLPPPWLPAPPSSTALLDA
jgi:hypothetical protein